MVRRRFAEEPMSRLALWSYRLAIFSLVATVLSIIIVRSGILEVEPALATFGAALSLAVLAILMAFAAFVVIWRNGNGGLGKALGAIGIGLILLGYPAYLGFKSTQTPAIHDITTDTDDPPRYEAVQKLRPRAANSVIYGGAAVAQKQRAAYPDIDTAEVDLDPPAAYKVVLAVVERHKWRIVDAQPPRPRSDGHIEAIARTLIMGFRDDIVIRIRADEDGSKIDIRSSSRYGEGDFGDNAARVRSLSDDLDTAIQAAIDRRPQPPAKPAPAPPPPRRSKTR
jgi:uncharacterized protein (DUF1499 family)